MLNRALAGDGSLHLAAQQGEHRQSALLVLLHLHFGSRVRVVGQTQRVNLLATRGHQIMVPSTVWTTVHTVSLDGTHHDNLAGQLGKDGLGAHQRGGTHADPDVRLEDHGTSLEPHTFAGTTVDGSSRLQLPRGQAHRVPNIGVSTSQARRRHEARHLPLCRGGGGLAVWLPSSPFLPCVRTPGAPPAGACTARASYGHGRVVRPAPSYRCLPILPLCPGGGGGRCPPLPTFFPHPWGGGGLWGGGGKPCRHPFVARMAQARRKHGAGTRRGTCPSTWGGGMPCGSRRRPSYPVYAPPVFPRWGLHSACSLRARSCGPSRTLSPLPPRRFVLGGGALFAPPYLLPPPLGGRRCVGGGGGALVVFPLQHARRRHDASMAQARGAALVPLRGGGVPCVTRRRPSYPACAPPGGRRCVGWGGGTLVVLPSLHACRRHEASTTQARGEALGRCHSRFQDAHGARHDAWQVSPTLPPVLPASPSVLAWC